MFFITSFLMSCKKCDVLNGDYAIVKIANNTSFTININADFSFLGALKPFEVKDFNVSEFSNLKAVKANCEQIGYPDPCLIQSFDLSANNISTCDIYTWTVDF